MLIAALGLTLILVEYSGRPHAWRWLTVVTGVQDHQAPWLPPAAESPPTTADPASFSQDKSTNPPSRAPRQSVPTGDYFPGVESRHLASIRDDTTFRNDEQPAWSNLLKVLDRNPQSALDQASIGSVAFSQLFAQPEVFRARLVTLAGTLRRVHLISAPPNDSAIDSYYQAWLLPSDRPDKPLVLYLLHLPQGFPTGMTISEPVEVTGFFFKLWAYQGRDQLHTTPTLVARTLRWEAGPTFEQPPPDDPGNLLLWIGLVLAASIVTAIVLHLRTRPRQPLASTAPLEFDAPALDALANRSSLAQSSNPPTDSNGENPPV